MIHSFLGAFYASDSFMFHRFSTFFILSGPSSHNILSLNIEHNNFQHNITNQSPRRTLIPLHAVLKITKVIYNMTSFKLAAVLLTVAFLKKSLAFDDIPNNIFLDERIIGGSDAGDGEYPWFAMALSGGSNNNRWGGCGGMLVAPEYVLTAAHCGSDYDAYRIGALCKESTNACTDSTVSSI